LSYLGFYSLWFDLFWAKVKIICQFRVKYVGKILALLFFVFGKSVGKNKCAEMCGWLFSMCGNGLQIGAGREFNH
jgi:hypothetical protein